MSPLLVALLLQARWVVPPSGSVALDGAWRFHAGDSAAFASPAADDARWDAVPLAAPWTAGLRGFGWYRGRFVLDRAPPAQLALGLRLGGLAYEVYVDGARLGGVGAFPPDYRARTAMPVILAIPLTSLSPGAHVIAIRAYSVEARPEPGAAVAIEPLATLLAENHGRDLYALATALLFAGLALSQLMLWARRLEAREHLYLSLFCATLALLFVNWMPAVRLALSPAVDWYRFYVALGAVSVVVLAVGALRIFEVEAGSLAARGSGAVALYFGFLVPLVLLLPGWGQVRWVEQFPYDGGLLVAVAVLVLLSVAARRRDLANATTLFWGSVALALAVLHDVALSWGWLPEWGGAAVVVQYGAIVFVGAVVLTAAGRFAEAQTIALYDRLTHLYRREVVMDALTREIRRAARVRESVTVVMIDVDQFKAVNDSVGHQAGDRVLDEVGRRLAEAGRAVDWLGRYGGDEFLAVLAATGRGGAVQAAERLRAAVSALPITVAGRASHAITVSAGVATYDGSEEWPTAEQLVGAADAALYRAKHDGRNCTRD